MPTTNSATTVEDRCRDRSGIPALVAPFARTRTAAVFRTLASATRAFAGFCSQVRTDRLWRLGIVLIVVSVASCRQAANVDEGTQSVLAANTAASQQPADAQSDASDAPTTRNVFHSPLAGTWYDADQGTLVRQIDGYLKNVSDAPLPDVCAVILPHAGYRWSGQTAAYGIKQLRGRTFRRVVVMGPSHHVPMENICSVPDATHYATPLGEVPLDRSFIAELLKHSEFQHIRSAHQGEHSVQIELPLLQTALGNFQFVPIVVGQLDRPTIRKVGRILLGLIDPQTLVVASSDFTHYGQNYGYFPFREDVAANLKKLDMGSWNEIQNKNLDGFLDYIDKTGTTICGRYGIGVLLAMLPEASKTHLLHYDTSGRATGDYMSSVSYLAIAVTGHWQTSKPVVGDAHQTTLPAQDRQQLLKLARSTLTFALEKRKMPTPEQLDIAVSPAMKQIAGAFVTLKKKGQLRGCIGEMFPSRPVYRAVMAQAINAGLNDSRFPQVQPAELADIDFEISVLTPPHPVASRDEIVIGKHGIILKKEGHSAVFLPQVAVEQNWDLDTTLTYLARKAGLPGDAWRSGASFEVFEAIVFGEHEK